LEMLASNVIKVTEAYSDYLVMSEEGEKNECMVKIDDCSAWWYK